MNLKELLEQTEITVYHLSKISGIPKSTINDICSGRSKIENCSAKTIKQLAQAFNCTMDDIMELSSSCNENKVPKNKSYLECGLPDWLKDSIQSMIKAWDKIDSGEKYPHWDCDYCNLQTDINNAEVNQIISSEQAWYLREKYLRIKKEEINETN